MTELRFEHKFNRQITPEDFQFLVKFSKVSPEDAGRRFTSCMCKYMKRTEGLTYEETIHRTKYERPQIQFSSPSWTFNKTGRKFR